MSDLTPASQEGRRPGRAKYVNISDLRSCQHRSVNRILQLSRTIKRRMRAEFEMHADVAMGSNEALRDSSGMRRAKLLIRLGKSLFLGSDKATTRSKRRITARVEGTGPWRRIPTQAF